MSKNHKRSNAEKLTFLKLSERGDISITLNQSQYLINKMRDLK
jgi:hypothetical protein